MSPTATFFTRTAGYSTTDSAASYATASWAPSLGKLYIAWIVSKAASNAPSVTLSGNGMTWTQTEEHYSGVTRLTMFRAVATAPSTGVTTITPGTATNTGMGWIIDEVTNADTGGTNGSNAIVQTAVASSVTAATSQTATLGTAITSGNSTMSAVTWAAQETGTEKSGWTKLGETNGASPATGMFSQYKAAGETGASASWTTSAGMRMITAEIKPATGYHAEVIADSPAIYWSFDETTGGPANYGSEVLGTVTVGSGVTKTATGARGGNAWAFDGTTNAHVAVNDSDTKWTDKIFTAECFFKSSGVSQYILGLNIGGTHNWYVYISATGSIVSVIKGSGSTQTKDTVTTYNDGAYHHLAVVYNSTTCSIYVDGTAIVAASAVTIGTFSTFSTGSFTAGSQTGTPINGSIDEVAVYDSALTGTRIGIHAAAGAATDAGYTAQAMTADATVVAPSVGVAAGYTASAVTASGAFADPVVHTNTYNFSISDDTKVTSANTGTNYGSDTTIDLQTSDGTRQAMFKWDASSISGGEVPDTQTLNVYMYTTSTGTVDIDVYRIDGTWAEGTVTYNTRPAITFLRTITGVSLTSTATLKTLDVSGATPYGVLLDGTGESVRIGFESSENGTTAHRPTITVSTAPAVDVSPAGGPMTASEAMPDPVVTTTNSVSASGGPMTASAAMPTPIVYVEYNNEFVADEMTGDAEMGDAQFASPISVPADPFVASATIVEPSDIGTTIGVNYHPDPFTVSARLVVPSEVNGSPILVDEADDDYFIRVENLGPRYWFRLNNLLNGEYENRIDYRVGENLQAHGTEPTFGGPAGRHALSFNGFGAYLKQEEQSGGESAENEATLEFTFKTNKENEFIMGGFDKVGTGGLFNTKLRELYLVDGKIQYRIDGVEQFTGFQNLADNEWHHFVILTRQALPTEIYVDGELEIRRITTGRGVMGFPDNIGGNSTTMSPSEYFSGQMTELVYYPFTIGTTDIQRNYYAVMGWEPFYADPFRATGTTVNAVGRGNQKKALYLVWRAELEYATFVNALPQDNYDFDPFPYYSTGIFGSFDAASPTHPLQGAGYSVYMYGMESRDYKDEVTDERRLIDLTKDVDLNEFDVIVFKDWPDEGYEEDMLEAAYGENQWVAMKEKLLGQIRNAVDDGHNLMITNSRLAVELGIIDRVEFCETFKEHRYVGHQNNGARGAYDYASSLHDAWIPDDLKAQWAYYYADTHNNNSYRVKALIEGLTDIPSVMLAETMWFQSPSPFSDKLPSHRYIVREENGLQIGDEFIFYGVDRYGAVLSDTYNSPSNPFGFSNRYLGRFYGAYATPPGHVLAGTVVTTFANKIWQNESEIDNPYKDYATTIVLRPGDNLKGSPIGGKIYVNFTESATIGPRGVSFQMVPPNEELDPRFAENAAQRAWQYSYHRLTKTSTNIDTGKETVTVLNADGTTSQFEIPSDGGFVTSFYNNIYPTETHDLYEMNFRGLLWLGDDDGLAEGDKRVAAATINATGEMVNPTVQAQRSVNFGAQPMLANAEMRSPAEAAQPSATVLAFPMEASATIKQPNRAIAVAPMTADAEFVENPDIIKANSESIVLYLHNTKATLFMKEDA